MEGKAVFVSDELNEATVLDLLPGYSFCELWASDVPPVFPDAGQARPRERFFPPVGGFRFGLVTIPPSSRHREPPRESRSAAIDQASELLPGLFDFHEPGGSGFHKTPTIDFEVILSGELTLEMNDGSTVLLGPGDTVVQNGTRHRWVNNGSEPATYAVFIAGALHSEVS